MFSGYADIPCYPEVFQWIRHSFLTMSIEIELVIPLQYKRVPSWKRVLTSWMVSPTRWTWVRVNSRRWWRTGKPGVLQSMGSQRVGHDLATSLVAQRVKHLPAMRETWVWKDLGQEDPLEKEMSTHSSIFAWRITWMEEPGGLQSVGSQRVGHEWATSLSFFHFLTTKQQQKVQQI